MGTLTNTYSDIDFTFTATPVIGDVGLSYDKQAVIRSIRNLVSTRHFEKLFNPDIGSNIENMLFEPTTIVTATALENEITNLINNWEPRVVLQNVRVSINPDYNSYNATIAFYITNQTQLTTVAVTLERTR